MPASIGKFIWYQVASSSIVAQSLRYSSLLSLPGHLRLDTPLQRLPFIMLCLGLCLGLSITSETSHGTTDSSRHTIHYASSEIVELSGSFLSFAFLVPEAQSQQRLPWVE
jgi:hypothetical protein